MQPLARGGPGLEDPCWGLFEVYRKGTTIFTDEDVARGAAIVESTSAVLDAHQRSAA